jgi:predicted lipid-binding transport protein (Tim44 family)
MARQGSQSPLSPPTQARAKNAPAMAAAKVGHDANGVTVKVVPKTRQIHKAGEVNISAYFPADVKASLRMVQAKTGYNVKSCLAEALRDLFRKHNVPVSVELGEGR